MKNKNKILLLIFVLVAIAQLWIPISMILEKEKILTKGEIVKFKLTSRDPVNPFKGKYLRLSFEESSFKVNEDLEWERNKKVFVFFSIDGEGFAKIDSVTKTINEDSVNYVIAKLNSRNIFRNKLFIKYPFEEYYIEESKAKSAEKKIGNLLRKGNAVVYAEIAVLDGETTLKDVFINDKTLLEFLKE